MPTCLVVKRMLSTRTRMLHVVHHSCSCIIMDAFSEYLKQGPACTLKTQKEKKECVRSLLTFYSNLYSYQTGDLHNSYSIGQRTKDIHYARACNLLYKLTFYNYLSVSVLLNNLKLQFSVLTLGGTSRT